MKKTAQIFVLSLLLGCTGDHEYVRFETAQPEGVKASKSFKRNVKGEYINCSNLNDKIIISDKLLLHYRTFSFKAHRNDLELYSTISIDRTSNNNLINLLENEGYKIEIVRDTIIASQITIDTIFQISESQVLKKFKGSYFLNFKEGETFWNVNRLNLVKDTLLIGQIIPSDTLLHFDFIIKKEELNELDSTTTTEYSIKPSRKEFKKLMKPNSFEETECYCQKK